MDISQYKIHITQQSRRNRKARRANAPPPAPDLSDTLTLFYIQGADYANHIDTRPPPPTPRFSDIPTAHCVCGYLKVSVTTRTLFFLLE